LFVKEELRRLRPKEEVIPEDEIDIKFDPT